MAGFFEVNLVGEFFNQVIVNSLWYRSEGWLPNNGNPFDDTLEALDAVIAHMKPQFLACMSTDYTLNVVTGTGYKDDFSLATSSPVLRNRNDAGTAAAGVEGTAGTVTILSLRCGQQHQINGIGSSKRNRGYLAIGPVPDGLVDDYSHITDSYSALVDTLGQKLDDTILDFMDTSSLIPIRIHQKVSHIGGVEIVNWRTYSDVLGYKVNRLASYRRSRRPRA